MTREDWRKEGFAYGEVKKESVYMLTGPENQDPGPDSSRCRTSRTTATRSYRFRSDGTLPAAPGRGGRRLRPHGDLGDTARSSKTAGSSVCAPATRAVARTASRSGTSSPGPTSRRRATVLAEGCWGHITGAAIKEFDLAEGSRAAGVGARRQGGLEGQEAARSRDPHVRAAVAAESRGRSTGSSAAPGSTR